MGTIEFLAFLKRYINARASCIYNNKPRRGRIVEIKQGPCYRLDSGEFEYMNSPDAEVYVVWEEISGERKTFMWARVQEFRIGGEEVQVFPLAPLIIPEPNAILSVRRVRPTLGV